jgi:hypothetical protein
MHLKLLIGIRPAAPIKHIAKSPIENGTNSLAISVLNSVPNLFSTAPLYIFAWLNLEYNSGTLAVWFDLPCV